MKKETPKVVEGRRFDRGVWVPCHACYGDAKRKTACQICAGKGKLWKRL